MTWASDASRLLVWGAVGLVAYVAATIYLGEFVSPLDLALFGVGLVAVLALFWYYADELRE